MVYCAVLVRTTGGGGEGSFCQGSKAAVCVTQINLHRIFKRCVHLLSTRHEELVFAHLVDIEMLWWII